MEFDWFVPKTGTAVLKGLRTSNIAQVFFFSVVQLAIPFFERLVELLNANLDLTISTRQYSYIRTIAIPVFFISTYVCTNFHVFFLRRSIQHIAPSTVPSCKSDGGVMRSLTVNPVRTAVPF